MKQWAVAVRAVAFREGSWLVWLSGEGTGSGERRWGVRGWRGVEEARRARRDRSTEMAARVMAFCGNIQRGVCGACSSWAVQGHKNHHGWREIGASVDTTAIGDAVVTLRLLVSTCNHTRFRAPARTWRIRCSVDVCSD